MCVAGLLMVMMPSLNSDADFLIVSGKACSLGSV